MAEQYLTSYWINLDAHNKLSIKTAVAKQDFKDTKILRP